MFYYIMMKKYYPFLYLFFIIVVALSMGFTKIEEEGFTTGIRKIYNPYIRHVRVTFENLQNHYSHQMTKLFRQFGLN